MVGFSPDRFEILFNTNWPATCLVKTLAEVDRTALWKEYRALRHCAPRRESGYFVERHEGSLSKSGGSNRFEEHLAIALWRKQKDGFWPRPSAGGFRLLDYQVPLKAQLSDEGVGKVDLLGVTDSGRLVIVELKVKPKGENGRGESPAAALLQGLRYAAIVEANRTSFAREAEEVFNTSVVEAPPIVQILAPQSWWLGWLQLGDSTRKKAGCWEREFIRLARDIEKQLCIVIECVALKDLLPSDIGYGPSGNQPQIDRALTLHPVHVDETSPIGPALAVFVRRSKRT